MRSTGCLSHFKMLVHEPLFFNYIFPDIPRSQDFCLTFHSGKHFKGVASLSITQSVDGNLEVNWKI